MPRKKLDPNRTELVPEDEFEDALSAVLRARPEKVNERLAKMQAENKAKREVEGQDREKRRHTG